MTLIELPDLIQGTNLERFREFIPWGVPAECWNWTGSPSSNGYGKFWLNGKTVGAHRLAYEVHNGPIPVGSVVRHTCDNKLCVNPGHLLLGDRKDNARDAVERGLYRRGSGNGRAKLTERQVSEIRDCWSGGETQVSMARRFGVSRAAIQWVLNGKNWAGMGETA